MCRWCQCDPGDECCDTREMAAAGTTEVTLGRRTATTREGEGEARGTCRDAARRRRYIATCPATPLHSGMTTRRQRYIAAVAAGRGGWAARPGTTGTYAQFSGVPQGRDWCEGLGRRPLPCGYIATALHGYSRLGLALEPGGGIRSPTGRRLEGQGDGGVGTRARTCRCRALLARRRLPHRAADGVSAHPGHCPSRKAAWPAARYGRGSTAVMHSDRLSCGGKGE